MKTTSASKAAKTKAQPDPQTLAQADPSSPQDTTQDYDPSKDRLALRELIARRGQPDAEHRAAYDELISDADRAALGARTRAAGVFRDAVAWGVQIDQDLSAYPALVKSHYAETRFAYFLERASLLGDAVAAQQTRRGDQGATRTTAQERETTAREARKTLIAKLRGVAGKRDAEGKALADAMGRTEDVDALGTSIQRLTTLGTEWLARPETSAKIHCASAGLTAGVISAALAAAKALTGAASEATLAGRRPSADEPVVNLLEGAVLHEMDEAQRCFNDAHTATQVVRRLSPGPATRHVLGTKKTGKPTPEDTHAATAASGAGASAT
jgi:hypothetical protein